MKLILCLLGMGLQAQSTFPERARGVIEWYAHPTGRGDSGYATIASKLKLHEDPEFCSRRLLELLNQGPSGDMFWMYPVTAIAFLDRGQLSAEARTALKRSWKTYMPYRGDTENHWLMYYASLYLMAQHWPKESGDAWYTGKTSSENFNEARQWIEGWVKLTTTRGQGEYDCTHYIGMYLLSMSMLSEWAEDPAMKKRATMMLDYLLADYAAENLDGMYVGAHARTDERMVLEKSYGVAADIGWVLWGLGQKPPAVDGYSLYYLLAGSYQPPEVLRGIATDRSQPYTHYERKRTRNRWRYHDGDLHGPVYKTTYVRKEYAVGSDQGGILQPIQQHSWDVTWSLPDARGKHNTLFFTQPHSSLRDLQTYFLFGPDSGNETVVRSKRTYDSPDKLLGGSPYEKVFQDQDTIIALYDVPAEERFPHINGFFSKDLTEVVEDPSGWIFARGGDTWIACRPLQPYVWKPLDGGDRRLFSPYRKNGVIVQAAAASEYRTAGDFRKAILTLPLTFMLNPAPSVEWRSLRGHILRFSYGAVPSIDAKPLEYASWPLFGGPFLEAAVDSGKLLLKYGSLRRELDFEKLTVRDSR